MKIIESAAAHDFRGAAFYLDVARITRTVARAIAAGLLCLVVLLPGRAEACGWGGENWDDEDIEEIFIGADGKPIVEEDDWLSDPENQTRLGNRHRNGQGVPIDYAAALRWYRLAAAQAHPAAQNNLGGMYEHGQGVVQDYAEAVEWYRRSAQQGDPQAQHSLGQMLRDGRGVVRDPAAAIVWIRKAAQVGHIGAFHDLGAMYWDGQGIQRDALHAYMWWTIATAHGDQRGVEMRARAAVELSPDLIAEAEKQARDWAPGPVTE